MKHCEKHNQDYMDFLQRCPICRGEEMVSPECHTVRYNDPDHFNKTYLQQTQTTPTTTPDNLFKRVIPPPVRGTPPPVLKRTEKPVKTVPPKGYLF